MKSVFTYTLIILTALSSFAQDITGDWNAMLNVGGSKLPLVFHFTPDGDAYVLTMDSPAQNAYGLIADSASFSDGKVTVEMSKLRMTYEGTLNEDGDIVGNFSQGGMTLPLTLTRGEATAQEIFRPQNPLYPLPYNVEEVTFENKDAGVTLAGTLTTPKQLFAGRKNLPAVILVSGSGPQNRDEEILGHKPFLVLADHLTKKGFAVLRYDDRGTAQSTGDFAKATTLDLASDTQAAFAFLQQHKLIDDLKIGIIGHSEGGLIAPIVASTNDDVAFIVLLAGVGIPMDELLAEQSYLISKAEGAPEEDALKSKEEVQKTIAIIKKNRNNPAKLEQELSKYVDEALVDHPKMKPEGMSVTDYKNGLIRTAMSPWYRNVLEIQPSQFLKDVACPVYAINGTNDVQVPAAANLNAIEKYVKQGGNDQVTIQSFENLNHLFQTSETGSLQEYGTIEETFAPVALEAISDWLIELYNE